uniref:Lipoprotein n=1 Tax=Siphoviridae sp. ctqv63 TaxID=2827950 RepID=A0A8S5SS52_9CAUD|nr:MAG TPA: hypothetical protein [Siphoviridae sp. ctqv63]
MPYLKLGGKLLLFYLLYSLCSCFSYKRLELK